MTRSSRIASRSRRPEIRLVSRPGETSALYLRLASQLREHILSGQLASGARLPSARTLSADLRVSRNTVELAMARLVDEGLVERRVGAGTMVAASAHESAPFAEVATRAPRSRVPQPWARPSVRGARMRALGGLELQRDAETGPWGTNLRRFPLATWTRLLARRARRGGYELLSSSDPLGLPELRREIARHASLTRGLQCAPEQVLVVGSTQEVLDLAARVVLDPGDVALVEDPGYASAYAALAGAGARLVPLPVDADGLVTRSLPRRGRPRLLYVTPSHQFPLGITMSLARRLEVLQWAAACDAWVIEDDYDSEFGYDGQPLAALQALGAGRVFYVGTYNKVLFPGLRLAYLILPESWVPTFAGARRISSGAPSPLLQSVLAEFLASGGFVAHLRAGRQFYARCRDRLIECVAADWGDAVRLGPSASGLHLVALLAVGSDDVALARAARRHALSAIALSRYYLAATPQPGLVISFGAADPERIAAGVRAMAPQMRRLGRATTHRSRA